MKTQQNALVAPIDWSDNFIIVFSHQSEIMTADFSQTVLHGETPLFAIEGINSIFEIRNEKSGKIL